MNATVSRHLLFALAFAMALFYFLNLPFDLHNSSRELMNHFFGADCWRVLENLKDTEGLDHYRDNVHPYFSLFAVSIAKLGSVFRVEGAEFVLYRSVFGTLGVFLFWTLIYAETNHALLAFSATLLLLSTFTVRLWSSLPETGLFVFFTLMLSLNLVRMRASPVLVLLVSLSGTVTNAFLGVSYLIRRRPPMKDVLPVFVRIACCVVILSLLQNALYPSSGVFFDIFRLGEERGYIIDSVRMIPFRAFDFMYSGFNVPLPETWSGSVLTEGLWAAFWSNLTAGYERRVAFGTVLTLIIVPLLVSVAFYRWAKDPAKTEVCTVTALLVTFQCALHLVYGDMPFLYSFNFVPLLILLVALQSPKTISSAVILIAFAAILQLTNQAQLVRFIQMFG